MAMQQGWRKTKPQEKNGAFSLEELLAMRQVKVTNICT